MILFPTMTIYYLEMTSLAQLREKAPRCEVAVCEAEIKNYRFNRFLYQLIGEPWQWTDKLALSDEVWQAYAENDNLRTWVATIQGSIAGYYELQQQAKGDVELRYFGLAPDFLDKGIGGYLLTHAIQTAWAMNGTKRVWVHTCSEDHPSALANYKARGFSLYDEVEDVT
ncbi:GNAT family N-acetyltransferase [Leucothrix sargassi]|nr:GNAT family N-acetyltransferase [Leucothrix sargassi]